MVRRGVFEVAGCMLIWRIAGSAGVFGKFARSQPSSNDIALDIFDEIKQYYSISSSGDAMPKASDSAAQIDSPLKFERWLPAASATPGFSAQEPGHAGNAYLVSVEDEAMSRVLEAMMPVLGRVLREKIAQVRERKLEELVDFIAGQMVSPSGVELRMAQRIAARHVRVLNEFGFATAEQLADLNQSRAANRNSLADNWKKRGQVFAVRHPDADGRMREVFPLFQFENHQPIKTVQSVLEAFGAQRSPWKLALWFTSNNGWLAGQARPVDLLTSASDAVVQAARRDADGSAA